MTDGNETIKRGTTTNTHAAASGGPHNAASSHPPPTTLLGDSGNSAARSPDLSANISASHRDSGVMSRFMGNRNRAKSQAPSTLSSSTTSSSGSTPHRPPPPSPMSDHPPSNSKSDTEFFGGPVKSPSFTSLSAFGTLTATITRTFARSPHKPSATGTTSPASHVSSSSTSTVTGGTADADDASRRTSIASTSTMMRRQKQLEAEEEANRGITLSYRFKNFTACPVSEWNATDNITTIMLSNNCLMAIPDELCNLPFLRTLSLSTNQLATINPNIVNLVTLQTLNLSANQLTTAAVDEVDWSLMGSLRALYLVRNKLTAFPKSVMDTEIETLSLSDNLIDTIPPEINTMAHLQWIGLSNNKISSLDPLFTLHQLSGVTIAGNCITETDSLKRRLRHLTRTMRLSATEASESPLEFMNRARTMTQQLERQLVRELARHSVISPNAPGASPNSPLVVAGSPFNVFRPMTPPAASPQPAGGTSSPGSAGASGRFTAASRTTFAMGKAARGSGSGTLKHAAGSSAASAGIGVFGGVGVSRMAREMSMEKLGMNAMRSGSMSDSADPVVGTRGAGAGAGGAGGSPLSVASMNMKSSGMGEAGEGLLKMVESPQKVVAVVGETGLRGIGSATSGESDTGTIRMRQSVEAAEPGS